MNLNPSDVGAGVEHSGDEHILKVRKPYTITKQRERWSEEEHKKFLEALQLYGRAWRQIEEHIGTKTTVQIRSHAQKFFSKVVRESAADSAGNVTPIEIPPPRPKRKPTHPYPRKFGNTSGCGGLTIPKFGRSLSPVKSAYDLENGSPTSVLSGVGSDALGSLQSNLPNNGSPTSVLSGVGSDALGSLQSNLPNSCASNEREPFIEEENMTAGLTTAATDDAPKEEQVPCLKLFGKTVMLTVSHKQPPPRTENATELLPTPNFVQGELSTWNLWSGGTFPMFYPLPSSTKFGDMPWWGACANMPQFSFSHRPDENSRQVTYPPLAKTSGDNDGLKECSGTGSNMASISEGANAVSSKDSPAIQSKRARSDGLTRGFVPYKRCVVWKDGAADDDSGEGQSVALCL